MNTKTQITNAIAKFPEAFNLRAWPDRTFRINEDYSYVNDSDQVQLVVDIADGAGRWVNFWRGDVEELEAQIIRRTDSGMQDCAPTPEQIDALRTFAKSNGRTWKSKLRECWMSGLYSDYPGTEDSASLQQVRNQFGPTWLSRFKAIANPEAPAQTPAPAAPVHVVDVDAPRTRTTLPVIVGKPYTPPRTIKPYDVHVECTDEDCKAQCYCEKIEERPHLLRHHTEPHEHRKTIQPPQNGTGWLERKASGELVYHTPWLKALTRKPFSMPVVKARNETAAKALVRLRKEYTTPAEMSLAKDYKSPGNGPVGRSDGAGYVCIATNGHWALMEPGKGAGNPMPFLAVSKEHKANTVNDSELHNAVKRAEIMADERSRAVALVGDGDTITVYSAHSDTGDFIETVPAKCARAFKTALDWKYLEPALGVWPMTLWVKDEESAVVFEPVGGDWRMVIMPMRYGFEGVEKAIAERDAEMYPNWGEE